MPEHLMGRIKVISKRRHSKITQTPLRLCICACTYIHRQTCLYIPPGLMWFNNELLLTDAVKSSGFSWSHVSGLQPSIHPNPCNLASFDATVNQWHTKIVSEDLESVFGNSYLSSLCSSSWDPLKGHQTSLERKGKHLEVQAKERCSFLSQHSGERLYTDWDLFFWSSKK